MKEKGLHAIYRVMAEHATARRWSLPLDRLDEGIDRLVIWDIGRLDEEEEAALERWVAEGHTALVGGPLTLSGTEYLLLYGEPSERALPTAAHPVNLGIQAIAVGEGRFGLGAEEHLVHLRDEGGHPVLISWPIGEGRLFWSADTEWLSNRRIGQEGNLEFALQILMPSEGKVVAFDEYHHGFQAATHWWQILRGSLQLFLLLLTLAVALLFWSHGARFGSPRPTPSTPPRAAVEYVHSMGLLYRRAQARTMVLQALYRSLTTALGRLVGGAKGLNHEEIALRTAQRVDMEPGEIERLLNETAPYLTAAPSDAELIRLARETELLQRRMQHAGFRDQQDPATGSD